jgi:hypothetical protein
MNNDLLTVKEVSEITGFTKQCIYKQLDNNLKKYVVTFGKKKKLSSLVIIEYFGIEFKNVENIENKSQRNSINSTELNNKIKSFKQKTTKFNGVFKIKSTYSTSKNEFNKFLLEEIKVKNEQLQKKDDKIDELTNKITDLTERLAILFENSQQLQQNQQLIEVKNIEKDNTEFEEKKQPFWKRLFKR